MSVTIKEIASIAGVSRGTVDRVLNNRGKVSREVEERVRRVADSLNYKPNSAAKAMAALRMKLLFGIVLPGEEHAFFIELMKGVNKAKEELKDMRVEIIVKEIQRYDVEHYLKIIDELLEAGITALAIFPLNDLRIVAKINEIVSRGIPVVTVTSDIEDSARNCYVGADFVQSGRLAARLVGMINANARMIVLSGADKVLSHQQRLYGFYETIAKKFPQVEIVEVINSNDNKYYAYEQVRKVLKEYEKIDIVLVIDSSVQGVCRAISTFAGREIQVVCFDDTPKVINLLKENRVCATVSMQAQEQGYMVMNCLLNFFTGSMDEKPDKILLDNIIKIRENFFD